MGIQNIYTQCAYKNINLDLSANEDMFSLFFMQL